MNRFILKFTVVCVSTIMLATAVPNLAKAAYISADMESSNSYEYENPNSHLARKDEIGYLYRIYNGIEQRRLWNYTRGIWLEEKWNNYPYK